MSFWNSRKVANVSPEEQIRKLKAANRKLTQTNKNLEITVAKVRSNYELLSQNVALYENEIRNLRSLPKKGGVDGGKFKKLYFQKKGEVEQFQEKVDKLKRKNIALDKQYKKWKKDHSSKSISIPEYNKVMKKLNAKTRELTKAVEESKNNKKIFQQFTDAIETANRQNGLLKSNVDILLRNNEKAHEELDEIYDSRRNAHSDMLKVIDNLEELVEELKKQRPGKVLLAHDSEVEGDKHFEYTKTMTDYLFKSNGPIQGGMDFTKFQVCTYTPDLVSSNPDARYEVLLYFIMASGGRHAIGRKDLFTDLQRRSKKVYIIACRGKLRFGTLEDVSNDQDFMQGVSCLNFLMAGCKIQENEHNLEVLRRIYNRLPEPPVETDTCWYDKYKRTQPHEFVKKLKRVDMTSTSSNGSERSRKAKLTKQTKKKEDDMFGNRTNTNPRATEREYPRASVPEEGPLGGVVVTESQNEPLSHIQVTNFPPLDDEEEDHMEYTPSTGNVGNMGSGTKEKDPRGNFFDGEFDY